MKKYTQNNSMNAEQYVAVNALGNIDRQAGEKHVSLRNVSRNKEKGAS